MSLYLLSQLESILSAISSLESESVTQAGDLLQYELLLQQSILLLVQTLMQLAHLGSQLIPAGNLAWQFAPPGQQQATTVLGPEHGVFRVG